MNYFDLHCDTIYRLAGFDRQIDETETLMKNSGHVDLTRTGALTHYAQIFALFCGRQPVTSPEDAHDRFMRLLGTAMKQFAACGERLRHCKNAVDFRKAQEKRQTAAFLSIEGAELLQSEADIRAALDAGVKIVTLAWNFDSIYACGAAADDRAGLKPEGRRLVRCLSENVVYLDVSHLSQKGFWELTDCTDAPILATHSNSKRLCGHKRNLTDEQALEIIRRDGRIGVNFYVPFITENKRATCDDLVRHVEHFCALGGERNLCIGADWDGCDRMPDDISDITDIAHVAEALARHGYTERQIAGFLYDNAARFVTERF